MSGWREHANCRGVDTELFFSKKAADKRMAARFCRECPVRRQCGEYADTHRFEGYSTCGMWGGVSRNQKGWRKSWL
ncbi:WhiB family transcriptional regulator [Bifidobacterium oedipodis]|uniref:WhiB family transcriptional regulator n=1 Tax=Bifidobacterium oedipodis TaxID=2675322 RepID=A0A7Y0EPF8_9BIFI|nr:WhiB family transcriptional regulator [Bifidobacterium sp. DSM 109957]NMM93922.1 WhiB family transcriptional regulator [Bifidobacterium sp. DSM 109957]